MSIDIEVYYRKYAPMVYRRCRSILGDDETSQDVTQEVFMSLLRKVDSLEDLAPSSLLYTMATNLSLNALKSGKTRQRHFGPAQPRGDEEGEIPSHDTSHASIDAKETLDQIFSLGDETTRTIAWMHYVDGYTLEETARHTGYSVSGVRKRLRTLQQKAQGFREAHL